MELWGHRTAGTWSCGNIKLREHGAVGTWSCGNIELWEHGTAGIWSCGNMELREHRTVGTWNCGNIELWEHGAVGTWSYGNNRAVGTWSCGGNRAAELQNRGTVDPYCVDRHVAPAGFHALLVPEGLHKRSHRLPRLAAPWGGRKASAWRTRLQPSEHSRFRITLR